MQRFLLCFLCTAVLAANSPVHLPVRFEPAREGGFLVHAGSRSYYVTPSGSLTFASGAAMHFAGSDPKARARPADPLPGKLNDLRGSDPSFWRTGIPLYGSLRVPNVYPGINLIYHGREEKIEYDFEVSPSASPNRIVLDFHGAEAVTRAPRQGLTIVFKDQKLYLRAPDIVQGNRRVPGGYRLLGGTRVGFRVGRYDHRRSLLIDPVLSYVDFFRDQGLNPIQAMASDLDGNIYVAGTTNRAIPLVSPVQPALGTGNCSSTPSKYFEACPAVFVAKLDPTGTQLIYSTYLGDDQSDFASSLAVDRFGNAYVAGTRRAASSSAPIDGVGFVFKLSAYGSSVIYKQYIGGNTFARAVAVDSNGNAYVAGDSIGFDFPSVNPLPVQPSVKSLFVTNDAGRTWLNINNGIKATSVSGLAVDPSRPAALFAAITLYAATSQGLYKSVNAGASWTRLLPEAPSVRDVVLDPQHPATVYATYAADLLVRSTDGGATWTTISANFPSPPPGNRPFDRTLLAFAVDPSNPQVLWATLADLLTGTVIKSDDAGAHWRIVYTFPPDTKITTDTLSALFKIGEILIDPKNSSRLYLCCVSRVAVPHIGIPYPLSATSGVYRTDNGGQSWIEGGTSSISGGTTGIVSPVLDPRDSNTLWGISNGDLQKSTDAGLTWTEVTFPSGIPNSGYTSFAIDPVSGALNLLNGAGFLLRSSDNGHTWTRSVDPPNPLASILAIDPVNASTIYAAAADYSVDRPSYAFVAKLNPDGQVLWATLLGGSGSDGANGIAVDLFGRVWVVGTTGSTDFPLVNAFQSALARAASPSYYDAFVSAIDVAGGKLLFSTYLGGTGDDSANRVAVDSAGHVYVAGATRFGIFPVLHPLQPSPAKTDYASFIAKIDSSTQKLVYSTLLTGSDVYPGEVANALAVDAMDAVWIGGTTGGRDLPLVNPVQSSPGAGFVARLAPGGNAFDFSSYVGDPGTGIQALAIRPDSSVWAAGSDGSLANITLAAPVAGVPLIRGLYNAATYYRRDVVSPGEILTIVGYELAGDTSVTIGGIQAPLLYTSSGQLNLQVPFELPLGATTLVIKRGDQSSAARPVNIVATTPGIFTVVHASDYSPITDQNPAHAGEYLVILCTGLGVTNPPAVTGELATIAAPIQADASAYGATVTYAGLAPGYIGLYQVNLQLNADIQPGQFSASLYVGNMFSNTVMIPVR